MIANIVVGCSVIVYVYQVESCYDTLFMLLII
jgi:hypothetical protein